MSSNLDRFKKDLEKLIDKGGQLELAMQYEVASAQFVATVKKKLGDKTDAFLKNLPSFNEDYEPWYSESHALLRQLLPDRVANFVSFYEKPKGRKDISCGTYVIQDYLQGIVVSYGGQIKVGTSAALPQFRQQLNIIKAASARFESSLFEIKQLVQADLFDSELEAGRELLKHKFTRAAGAIAGVVLEKHLRQVCEDRGLKITKKNPGISDLNELLKVNAVIEIPQWRNISMLGDIRNLCDHNKKSEPTNDQVSDLLNGTEKVIKTVF